MLSRIAKVLLLLTGALWCNACTAPALLSSAPASLPQPANINTQPESLFALRDEQWQRAATRALGEQEGTILIINPHTGHLYAAVNLRLASEQSFPPGSAIKPFTALAALRSGTLHQETVRRTCAGRYTHEDFSIVCSHPRSDVPFALPQALAYSCNDYFAHVGERLNASALQTTLAQFGFGARTEINVGKEAAGALPRNIGVPEALGESEQVLVTPLQMLLAYCALVNGGKLLRPQGNVAAPQIHRQLTLAPAHRRALLEGMRGAVKYGTAQRAQLTELPGFWLGKTGTATMSNGFRTHGWFVGFVADERVASEWSGVPLPSQIQLGFLVFLKRAHGSDGAMIMRTVMERQREGETERQRDEETEKQVSVVPIEIGDQHKENAALSRQRTNDSALSTQHSALEATRSPQNQSAIRHPQSTIKSSAIRHSPSAIVRVRLITQQQTRELPLEDYVRAVVAAEGSVESEPEALKALAVASRTYMLRNLGRHARAGYDFCSTTHCQRFALTQNSGAQAQRVRSAVQQTAGEVLRTRTGEVAEVYFSAACGGVTADIATLWQTQPVPYLRSVPDAFCAQGPHRNWTQAIDANDLARALRTDARTDVGSTLHDLSIQQTDASGRAQWLELRGAERKRISGWEFKLIIGRALGWHLLKSSRFTVRRVGDQFLFTGHGFGHGLGLCQEGAHVMAAKRMSYRAILAHYFPGLSLVRTTQSQASLPLPHEPLAVKMPRYVALQATRASEHFRVTYPASYPSPTIANLLAQLEQLRHALAERTARASLPLADFSTEVWIHPTTAAFIQATGHSGWTAAVTNGRRIDLQPLDILQRRGLFATTLQHELTHVIVNALSQQRAPRWLSEGMALHFANEGAALRKIVIKSPLALEQLEAQLAQPANQAVTRQLYAQAHRAVQTILQQEGEARLWRRVAQQRPRT